MKATSIPNHEKRFRSTGIDSSCKKHLLKPFEVAIPGLVERIEMIECVRENGDESFFFKEEFTKQRIVLHFTAGYLKGDIDTLTKPESYVSISFVIARDGSIYNLWTSKYWSYHLGPGAQGGNTEMSKTSIGIEISNIGYLEKSSSNLVTQYRSSDIYCSITETSFYTKIPAYRGKEYFATLEEEQYNSVIKLLRFLTAEYKIPREFLDESKRYDVVNDIASFKGITSHVNYRPTRKWDIGPAFKWDRVISGVRQT